MPGFYLYYSNRTEILLGELAEVVSRPPLPPLQREIIVVQSKGMEQWVSQQLASKFGIWANAWFPFPNRMLQELFQAVLPDAALGERFSPEILSWRIQSHLDRLPDVADFEPLKNYLVGGKRGLRRVQLCQRIADTLDQYTLYRPEIVLLWERNHESHWQAQLWRRLISGEKELHRAAIRRRFLAAIRKGIPATVELPSRISIFGIPSLPPFHLEVFAAVSGFMDVHLFLLSPSREYWTDILSEKEQARRQQRQRAQMQLAFPVNPYFETGHPLLASLGTLGRDFSGMLLDCEGAQDKSHYEDPGEETLLACLQSDVLNLRHRGRDGRRKVIESRDTSLQIHSCHSPLREMEVLYDHLLAFFDEDPALQPNDILVMTPDIESYAPYIAAVFGREREKRLFPFAISDRTARNESIVAQAFLKLLDLSGSRLAAPAVLDLLDMELVRRRFGIQPEDRDWILKWVRETRICWGLDGKDRERHGLPAFDENSWRQGIDRLLLGYAMPETAMFAGVLPAEGVEGSGGLLLGRFVEYLERLFAEVRDLGRSRTLAEWSESLLAVLSRFLEESEELSEEFQLLRGQLRRLADLQRESDFAEPIGLDAVKHWIEQRLHSTEPGQGFLSGGVTFCAMLPMRSIPFKVIALVGMDSKAFPRFNRPLGFDLMARAPKLGDRSLRSEDRYLFLEALLSAREKLHISYVGQSIRDNSELPPSVVLSELIDVLDHGFVMGAKEKPIREHVAVRHRLQAFSPSYFSAGARLFSFSEENLEALRARQDALGSPIRAPLPFVVGSIGKAPAEFQCVDVAELKRFYRNPASYFFRRRLGLTLEDDSVLLEEREPFALGSLDKYSLNQELTGEALDGETIDAAYLWAKGQGFLPAGNAGEVAFRACAAEVNAFVKLLRPMLEGQRLAAVKVDVSLGSFRVTGRLDRIWPSHLLRYRCAAVKAKDRLDVWIDHLLLQCCAPSAYPSRSLLAATDGVWNYGRVANAQTLLERLLSTYWEGLEEPLRFFPQSSYEYARSVNRGQEESGAMRAAAKVWHGGHDEQPPGERDDRYYQLAFGTIDPLDDRFCKLARQIFGALLEHEEERPS